MTDLQKLTALKKKPFVTNCFMLEREVFNSEGFCHFDCEIGENFFCFYKNAEFSFKKMYFYVNNVGLSENNSVSNKEHHYVADVISLDNKIEQRLQIRNWLGQQGNYHYRTIIRMYRLNKLEVSGLDFSKVQNPIESDFEEIRQHLEFYFDKHTERIPTLEELQKWQNSTYIIKHENKIAAILISELKGETNELHFWLVLPEYRGYGYGDLVFKYCLNCNSDIKRYTSWINPRNEYSIKKHLDCGFVKDRTINHVYLNKNIMTDKILKILQDARPEFDFNDESLNFIEAGYLDSLDIITIVDDLEKTFEVKINEALNVSESFYSIDSILKLIESSKNAPKD
jgi:acyl carrier protein